MSMVLVSLQNSQPLMLDVIRNLEASCVVARFHAEIPECLHPPDDFLSTLDPAQRILALRLCLLLYAATGGRICPRQFQLQAALASLTGRDCLVDAGTGSGKTLCMVLPMLLDPSGLVITVSPLKRLQQAQVEEFGKFGIKSMAINEDTPNDHELWKQIASCRIQHLIVQPEQLTNHEGRLPRLARLLRSRVFSNQIKRVNIDEQAYKMI